MKWFWYSLLGFILLMCSCGTKKSARLVTEVSKKNVRTELFRFEALKDTFNTLKIELDKSKLKITERITITKYDKDTGVITEETTTEREIAQDSDKVVSEEENQTVTDCNQLEVDHFRDVTEKVESEIKEESLSDFGIFWECFGKYLGIIMGIALLIGAIFIYLKKNYRVS